MSFWHNLRSELFGNADRVESSAATQSKISEERKDFIKRLFAVTISVGFATQLSHFTSSLGEQKARYALAAIGSSRSLALLVISLVAVVASWEGYLTSIERDPLEKQFRFYLDVVIVFIYLLLMLLSSNSALWFAAFAIMFVVYLTWDVVKVIEREHTSQTPRQLHQQSVVITSVWLIAASWLFHFKNVDARDGFYSACLAALSIILLYRCDKRVRFAFLGKLCLFLIPVLILYFGAKFC